MVSRKRALFLIGSPRTTNSASDMLCSYFINRLQKQIFEIKKMYLSRLLNSSENRDNLLLAVDMADMLTFACPLYLDGPPALVIKFMELIAQHRNAVKNRRNQQLFVISCCGHPAVHQNNVALDIYHQFALENNFEWLGGMAFGMGGILGLKLRKFWFMSMWDTKNALRLAAGAFSKGESVPNQAVILSPKPGINIWLYVIYYKFWIKYLSLRNGVSNKLDSRPYLL